MNTQSLVEMTSVPGVPHSGREIDREHGGIICSECGWHLGGLFLDTETQIRHHQEYVNAQTEPGLSAKEQTMATDVRQVMVNVLQQHASDGCDYCACGHRYSWAEGAQGWNAEWADHVADYMQASLRAAGIVGYIDQNATLKPRVYTDADHEVWVDP